jgi:zinc transport system substrate-binding protein
MRFGFRLYAMPLAAALVLPPRGGAAEEKPLIYVGLPPQRWLVRQLAGERVDIGLLLQPGQNPHTFEPTARQVRALTAARGYLMMGLPFERALIAKARGAQPGLAVWDVTTNLARRVPHAAGRPPAADEDDGGCEGADPHVWLSPAGMAVLASNTACALARLDPGGRAAYEAQLPPLCERIRRLDDALRATLAPMRGRIMLTYHASWGYFADAYGLRQVSIEAEGRAPAARQLAALIELAKTNRIRRIFTEPPYDPKPAETVARQIGATVEVIDPLAEAWDENLRRVAERVSAP